MDLRRIYEHLTHEGPQYDGLLLDSRIRLNHHFGVDQCIEMVVEFPRKITTAYKNASLHVFFHGVTG